MNPTRPIQSNATAVAIVAVVGALACAGCVRNDHDETEDTDPPYENLNPREELQRREQRAPQAQPSQARSEPATATVRTIADITGNAGRFIGEKVVIQGQIDKIYRDQGFRLDSASPAAGGSDGDLVILGPKNATWKVDDRWNSAGVRVEGTVQRAKGVDLEKQLGWTFESDVRQAVQGEELVLIAENVQRTAPE